MMLQLLGLVEVEHSTPNLVKEGHHPIAVGLDCHSMSAKC